MKILINYLKQSVILLPLMFSSLANADELEEAFENNTGTSLVQDGYEHDGVIVDRAYVWTHLYGQEMILEIRVLDLGFEKEIWIYDRYATYDFEKSKRVSWLGEDEEIGALRRGGPKAYYAGSHGKRDVIYLKIPVQSVLSWNNNVLPHGLDIFVKMGEREHAARNVQVEVTE